MNMMTNLRIRHIPVIENGHLAGIVSIGDLVKHLCAERGYEVKNLTDYITGQYPGEIGAGHI
jgi:signal-transduction protein with cAMP-binding, CBS, and nucleotidyltransferase domain